MRYGCFSTCRELHPKCDIPTVYYHMNHSYYGVFHKYTTLVLSHRKFATDKPLTLRARGLSVANFR